MRRTARSDRRTGARGFTLVEAIVVIALTGILAAVVSVFIVRPVQAYQAVSARSALADQADLALRHIGRDLRAALPNSVRTTGGGTVLELIPVTAAARYATEGAGALAFGSADSSFDIVGPPLVLASAGQQLVFHNLGTGVTGADAYADNAGATAAASSNRRATTNAAGSATTVTLDSPAPLPATAMAPPYRVFAVEPPVTYRCDLAAERLLRHTGYGFVATQAAVPTGGTSAVLATGVKGCRFGVDGSLVAARAALVNLELTIAATTSAGSESVTLQHAVFVSNLP